MKELTRQTIEAARANRAKGIVYNTDAEIIDLADEVDRLTALQGGQMKPSTAGPRTATLIGHHLTEAIRHLSAAAELSRELTREDANELACSLEHMREALRDARGDVETPER